MKITYQRNTNRMRNIFGILFIILITNVVNAWSKNTLPDKLETIEWDYTLKLPQISDNDNPGVAGAFSGFVGNQLVFAVWAIFPDAMPWDGGIKNWWQTAYAINVESKEANWNIYIDFLLVPLGYGVSILLPVGRL